MKSWHLIPVALVFTLAVVRFTPGTIPGAVETSPAPAATKAPHRDRPSPGSLSPQQEVILPSNPSSDATGDKAANQDGQALPIETIAAVPNAKAASGLFAKNSEALGQPVDPLPSVRHAGAPLPAADQSGTLSPTAGQIGTLLPAVGQGGAKLPATSNDKSPATSVAPTGLESAAEPGKSTTASVEDPVPPPPAALADLGSASTLTPEQDREVQQMAENWTAQLSGSGLDPASPEYRQLWTDATRQCDLIFMQQFGGEVWHAHHIEAYHLAHAAEEQP